MACINQIFSFDIIDVYVRWMRNCIVPYVYEIYQIIYYVIINWTFCRLRTQQKRESFIFFNPNFNYWLTLIQLILIHEQIIALKITWLISKLSWRSISFTGRQGGDECTRHSTEVTTCRMKILISPATVSSQQKISITFFSFLLAPGTITNLFIFFQAILLSFDFT